MTGPLVSCVVPVNNGEKYLAESLESILAQDYRPFEVIVVDDGSTDGTPEVIRGFGARVRAVTQAKAGPATARNTGLALCRGDLIAFNDSDDLWQPGKLAMQVALLEANPELDFCVSHVQNFWVEEMKEEAERFRGHPRSQPVAGWVTQTLVARRTAFDRVGVLNQSLDHGDSADWFLRARQAGLRSELLPDVLVRRRLHADNRSRKSAGASRDEFLALLKRTRDRGKESPA